MHLSARGADAALEMLFAGVRSPGPTPPTTADLFEAMDGGAFPGLVLDGVDAVQSPRGVVTDVRLRQLLDAAVRGRWPGVTLVVISQRDPPAGLCDAGVTPVAAGAQGHPVPRSAAPDDPILEALAASRLAVPGWALGLLLGARDPAASFETPRMVTDRLAEPLRARVVRLIPGVDGEQWFWIPAPFRDRMLALDRAPAVRRALAATLRHAASGHALGLHDVTPVAIALLADAGDVPDAVSAYWHEAGNFSALAAQWRHHVGAQLCRSINAGRDADDVAPALADSEGGWAVLNDWSQFAGCVGDVATAYAASQSAYRAAGGLGEVERAVLSRHCADACIAAARLPDAAEWARSAWRHATAAIRGTQGLGTAEIMDAFDHAAESAVAVVRRIGDAAAIQRELDALVSVNDRAIQALAELNRAGPLFPYPGPTEPADPDRLVDGRLAAVLALADGRSRDVRRLLERKDGSFARWADGALIARARLAEGRDEKLPGLLETLRRAAEQRDFLPDRCECAALRAAALLQQNRADEALRVVDAHLALAARLGLGLTFIDLLVARSSALVGLSRSDEARTAAEAALYGPAIFVATPELAPPGLLPLEEELPGALDAACDYRTGARAAIAALRAAGGRVADDVVAAATARAPAIAPAVVVSNDPAPPGDRPQDENEQRRRLDEASREVLRAYEERGMPFALSFRIYDVVVMHGPFEFGPQYVETMLRRALPPEAGVLALQQHQGGSYFGTGAFNDRRAPALFLGDDEWQRVVESLIPHADLIVFEPYFLQAGVRFELEAAQRHGCWDRTVLVLPPLNGPLPTIDNDPLIQMFPRCVWADELHTTPLTDAPAIADLLQRIRDLAALPDADRAQLTDPAARLAAHAIDHGALATRLEAVVAARSVLGDPQDPDERYYAFWRLFRAASLRAVEVAGGNSRDSARTALIDDYLKMSAIMLDHEREGDQVVIVGDLDLADKLVASVLGLAQSLPDGPYRRYVLDQAQKRSQELGAVKLALAQRADKVVSKPRYGPFVTRRSS